MTDCEVAAFTDLVRKATGQSKDAVGARGHEALSALAVSCVNQDNCEALIVRRFLLSLYHGANPKVSVSDILDLNLSLRKKLCAVLLGMSEPGLNKCDIRQAFEHAGDVDAKWFLENATTRTA